MEPTEQTLRTSHGTIHYWEYNADKKPVIFVVHGFRGTHHGLIRLIEQLPEYRIIVPDLPAFGASPAMKNHPHTVENYADALIDFIAQKHISGPILLGHSMGSIVVSAMIAKQPSLTKKAIFINPIAAKPLEGMGRVKLAPGIAYHHLAGRILPEGIGTRVLQNKLLFLIGSASMTKTHDRELRKWIHWNHITYMKRFSDRRSLLEAYDSSSNTTIRDYKEQLDLPVLMIAGVHDAIAPIKSQRRLVRELPQAKLVEIEQVGHIIHYEKPKEAAEAIRAFLAR